MANLMKQKLSIKNIIIATAIITAVASLVFFDHHRVQKDFTKLKADLMRIRLKSVTENNPLLSSSTIMKYPFWTFPKAH